MKRAGHVTLELKRTGTGAREAWTCDTGAEEDTGVKRAGHVTLELKRTLG